MSDLKINLLLWDSNFFKLRVSEILNVDDCNTDLKLLVDKLSYQNIDLAYLKASKKIIDVNQIVIDNYEATLVDQKITFSKNISKASDLNKHISEYIDNHLTPPLLNLAIKSGQYSRFKVDERIPNSKFEEMYRLWILNSVKREICDVVFVYKEGDEILGFITVAASDDRHTKIGLIAVDEKGQRKGIGKALMEAAEYYSIKNDYHTLKVDTQKSNLTACIFYLKCNFKEEQSFCLYHIWKLNQKNSRS